MKYLLLLTACFIFSIAGFCQKGDIVTDMDEMLAAGKHKEACAVIKQRVNGFFLANNADTIPDYINYLGKATMKTKNLAAAKSELTSLLLKMRFTFPFHKSIIPAYFETASFLSNQGEQDAAYNLLAELDNYFAGHKEVIDADLSALESNKGDYAMRSGKYGLATQHYLQSIEMLKRNPQPDDQKMYFANNALGIVMWYSSKLDSAVFYFSKAVDHLNKMEATPLNRNFRVALVQNNIAGCYNVLGKPQEAIAMFENVIKNYKLFLASPEESPKKENARLNQFQSIDNLAKIYLELGDFSKAFDLLNYSYIQKKNNFGDKSPEVYKSLIFLGTVYNNQRNYTQAEKLLTDAVGRIKEEGDASNAWAAEAYSQLAVTAKGLKDTVAADGYFKQASKVYEAVYGDQYDDLYLNYLTEMSLFYAGNEQSGMALHAVNKALNYVTKAQGENSLATVLQVRNVAGVNFELKQYNETVAATTRGLKIISNLLAKSDAVIDSVKTEMEKPRLILLQSKAKYELAQKRDSAFLNSLLKDLYAAQATLERRKTLLLEERDVNWLIANNKDIQDFIETLNYELYKSTGKATYLDKMIGSHEQGMYARIRSRMEKQKAIRFSNVPADVIEQETKLKQAIQSALKGEGTHDQKIGAYISAHNSWNSYQQMLKEKYPVYYEMRYASKEKTLAELCAAIPADITVVRYLFSGKDLFALVATNQQQQLVALPEGSAVTDQIVSLNNPQASVQQVSNSSFQLYKQLWQPLAAQIKTKRVMVIPDGVLYHLSFEMLATSAVNSFAELASKSLLSKHAISYHYSLLAISPAKKPEQRKNNFIGFSPGFSDQQKEQYSRQIKQDSMRIDNTYLSLLPLPFTTSLVKKIHDNLGGEVFLNDQSTPAAFRTQAGNHHIIYIGTHAESNNTHPEYSRLLFAKDPQKAEADNAMYLFDIYNCDLRSDLSILTACESGKPGYQDGEGMISMAHAFNYAGSESIMTALWKIDEQASTIITDLFYKHLQQGLTKDEALRQAKLDYLGTQNGRLLAPHYWAGLVIMGDSSPVVLHPKKSLPVAWIGAGVVLLALVAVFLRRRRRTAAGK